MNQRSKNPHVRLPEKADRILFLLCEDLKNNKFFNKLEKVGVEDAPRSELMFMVLGLVFKERSDDLNNLYLKLLEEYSKKVKGYELDSLAKQALNFYIDLMIEKKRRLNLKE